MRHGEDPPLPAARILSPSLGRQSENVIGPKRGIRGNTGKLADEKEEIQRMAQIGSDILCFSLSMSHKILEQREVIQMRDAFKRQTIAFKMFHQTDRWSAKHHSLLFFGAALRRVCPFLMAEVD